MGYKEVWFITGASTGFGLHLTKGLLQNGLRVAAVIQAGEDAGNSGLSDWAERAGEDPENSGNAATGGDARTGERVATGGSGGAGWLEGDLLCLTADLTNEDSVQAAIQQTIRQFGRIDNVVNYAGYDLPGPITTLPECLIHQYFEENVFGSFYVLKQVMPYLRAQRSGTILNFSSAAIAAAATGSMLYMASRLAIRSLTEQLTAGIEDLGIQQTFIGPAASLQRDDESLLPDESLRQEDRKGMFSQKDNAGGYREQRLQRTALV